MKEYIVIAEHTVTTVFKIIAESEDQAKETIMHGEFDDNDIVSLDASDPCVTQCKLWNDDGQ
jgi:hypothetical protein